MASSLSGFNPAWCRLFDRLGCHLAQVADAVIETLSTINKPALIALIWLGSERLCSMRCMRVPQVLEPAIDAVGGLCFCVEPVFSAHLAYRRSHENLASILLR